MSSRRLPAIGTRVHVEPPFSGSAWTGKVVEHLSTQVVVVREDNGHTQVVKPTEIEKEIKE